MELLRYSPLTVSMLSLVALACVPTTDEASVETGTGSTSGASGPTTITGPEPGSSESNGGPDPSAETGSESGAESEASGEDDAESTGEPETLPPTWCGTESAGRRQLEPLGVPLVHARCESP